MILITLLDFPFEERNQLTYWSDVAMMNVNEPGVLVKSEQERFNVLREMSDYVGQRFSERRKLPPGSNLLSMLANGAQDMQGSEFMGTLVLLLVGGNDTQLDDRRSAGACRAPGRISEASTESFFVTHSGAGDHSLCDARNPHTVYGGGGYRICWQANPRRRQGRHVVHLRQS
jgi:hypothetical protein